MSEILQHGIIFGSIFSIVQAAIHFNRPKMQAKNFYMGMLHLSIGILFAYVFLVIRDIYFSIRFINFLYLPALYIYAPSAYLLFNAVSLEDFELDKKQLFYALPAAFVLILVFLIDLINPKIFQIHPHDHLHKHEIDWPFWLFIGGLLYNKILNILFIYQNRFLFHINTLRKEFSARIIAFMVFANIFMVLFIIIFFLYHIIAGFYWGCFLVAVFVTINPILSARKPDLFYDITEQIKKIRYEQSRLTGLDLTKLNKELNKLMTEDKIFCDEELSLKSCAALLNLKDYQLSEFLNSQYNINFSRYINDFRIKEAQILLKQNPDASIISVAFQVGFNSKSNFNYAFKTITQETPSSFIKKFKNKTLSNPFHALKLVQYHYFILFI